MRRKEKKRISLRAVVITIISIFFLTISVGYSYLKQSLNITGKSSIVSEQGGDTEYEQGNSTYSWTVLNSWGDGTPDSPYMCQASITIINMDEDISSWEISFELPSSYNDEKSNAWSVSEKTYENGRLTLKAQSWNASVPKGEELTFEMQYAFDTNVEFYVENLTLNGKLATYEVQVTEPSEETTESGTTEGETTESGATEGETTE